MLKTHIKLLIYMFDQGLHYLLFYHILDIPTGSQREIVKWELRSLNM